MVFFGNVPLFLLGWRYLGGKRFAMRTAVAITLFSVFTDGLVFFLPKEGITHDIFLLALYGGVFLGLGLGLVYRGRGTSGGSDILGRILNHKKGVSISQAYLLTDGLVVLASGFAFGWERALYGLVVIYISGLTAELISEGNNIYRMAMIVTNLPTEVSEANLRHFGTRCDDPTRHRGMDRPIAPSAVLCAGPCGSQHPQNDRQRSGSKCVHGDRAGKRSAWRRISAA